MRYFFLCLTLMVLGCRTAPAVLQTQDEFDKILYLKKTNDPKNLTSMLGDPERVDKSDPASDQYYFPRKQDQLPIKVFVNRRDNKITTIALTYWVGFDAYAYLKKRFKDYKWIETSVESKVVDVVEDLYKVEIPELGISFLYNNNDPLRRPMWIFFNKGHDLE